MIPGLKMFIGMLQLEEIQQGPQKLRWLNEVKVVNGVITFGNICWRREKRYRTKSLEENMENDGNNQDLRAFLKRKIPIKVSGLLLYCGRGLFFHSG